MARAILLFAELPLYEGRNLLYNDISIMKMGGIAMNCIKCGQEPEAGQVFCQDCLFDMERHPVRINTPVHIPQQPPKKIVHRRPGIPVEEQVKRLKRANQKLILLMVLLAFITTFAVLLSMDVLEQASVYDLWGQNYSIVLDEDAD